MPLALDCRYPAGMNENSPGFQPWDCGPRVLSPEGTADKVGLSRPFGTNPRPRAAPGLKPWAILICPSGTTPGRVLALRLKPIAGETPG